MSLLPSRPVLYAGPVFLFILFFTAACTCDRAGEDRNTGINIDISDEELKDVFSGRQVFYALPSPLETAIMLKSAGAWYDEDLMNPVENVSRYMTNRSMALNLGIYITNISYASLFDQTQTCMRYMDAARQLAGNLGITDAIDQNTMESLEENLHNQEVIMDIVSETFMSSTSFLKENNREPVAAMMFLGGWIEGIYLALNLANEDDLAGNTLINRIAESKMSFEMVMLLLSDYADNKDIAGLIDEVGEIGDIFEKIEVRSSRVNVINAPDDPVAVLSSDASSSIGRDEFLRLKVTVTGIRNSFIK